MKEIQLTFHQLEGVNSKEVSCKSCLRFLSLRPSQSFMGTSAPSLLSDCFKQSLLGALCIWWKATDNMRNVNVNVKNTQKCKMCKASAADILPALQ